MSQQFQRLGQIAEDKFILIQIIFRSFKKVTLKSRIYIIYIFISLQLLFFLYASFTLLFFYTKQHQSRQRHSRLILSRKVPLFQIRRCLVVFLFVFLPQCKKLRGTFSFCPVKFRDRGHSGLHIKILQQKYHRVRVRKGISSPKQNGDAHFVGKNKTINDNIGTTYLLCLVLQVCVCFLYLQKLGRCATYF